LANSVSLTCFDNLVVAMTNIIPESFISNPPNKKIINIWVGYSFFMLEFC